MKVHFFSPARSIDPRQTVLEMYRGCGNNSGNMVFVNALASQIDYAEASFGYVVNAAQINDEYDAVVIPAANWINPGMNLQGFYDALKDVRKPCIVAGIGAQSAGYDQKPSIPDGTRRFLDLISQRSALIGTRGDYSSAIMRQLGYDNVVTTGCPSLFWNSSYGLHEIRAPGTPNPQNIVFQGTRHNIPNHDFYKSGYHARQRAAFQHAMEHNYHYVIQSELEEIYFALGRRNNAQVNQEIDEKLTQYYGRAMEDGLEDYLRNRMVFFTDLDAWRSYLAERDFVLTTRIHGSIMAMQSGTPALLLWHDARTREIADYAGLPCMPFDEFDFEADLADVARLADYDRARERYPANAARYVDYLEANGLPHRFAVTVA